MPDPKPQSPQPTTSEPQSTPEQKPAPPLIPMIDIQGHETKSLDPGLENLFKHKLAIKIIKK